MNDAEVKKKVEQYFTDTFPRFSVSQECEVSFGSKQGGFADVVLHTDRPGYFVAIAECKGLPPATQKRKKRAKEQLKSYMSATNTQYGVLALGEDPGNWEFCENKYHNYFVSINRETFERSVENWEPISFEALEDNLQREQKTVEALEDNLQREQKTVEALEDNLQRERKTARRWNRIALFLGILFIVSLSSLLLLWPDPPEPIVYITRTGTKYHTHNCKFVEDNAVRDEFGIYKYAIYLDKAQEDYDPCRICSPHNTEKSR